MDLRGHHLENIFRYLKEERQDIVSDRIFKDILYSQEIRIVDHSDYICLECAYGENQIKWCKNNPKLAEIDRKIAEEAGLKVGYTCSGYKLKDILNNLNKLGSYNTYKKKAPEPTISN